MSRLDITKAGTYVAVLNGTNPDSFYTKVFEYPGEEVSGGSALWFYLKIIDLTSCVDKIYPIECFEPIALLLLLKNSGDPVARQCAWCKKYCVNNIWMELDDAMQLVLHSRTTHGICPSCADNMKTE